MVINKIVQPISPFQRGLCKPRPYGFFIHSHAEVSIAVYALVGLFCWMLPAWAAGEMDAGIASFNKHDYRSALGHFTAALKADPNDCNALYYEAVTLHQLNEMNLAKQAYATIVIRYPGTEAAHNAQTALNYLNPAFLKKFQQQVASAAHSASTNGDGSLLASGSSPADLANMPDQVRIPYRREGNNLVVNAFINGHPLEMYFDSGADHTMVYKSQMQNLGLRDPHGAPTGLSYGVGDGGAQKSWLVHTSIKVGQIEHKDFAIAVQDDGGSATTVYPLLGENFFRGFSYKVMPSSDDSHGSILFEKKGTGMRLSSDNSAIPYKDLGRNMVVSVEVNGRTVPMIFDTGASDCCFTWHQWVDQMQMSIPDDAVNSRNVGIAGMTKSKHFNVGTMRLGPIMKNDVPISIIESGDMPYGLLGNSFFGDLHIEVDNSAHLIRVRR